MKTFKLVISSPNGLIFDEDVVKIVLRGDGGDLAVMAGHVPFMTSVKPCQCKIEMVDESVKTAHVEGGLLTVAAEKTTLLSGSFKWDKA
ncbi:MAG: F0F1 ATP synthase subunit epsilon [Clostridia bacterium]|nr:F0F1 ATP synthase subunit epsilon [Clostridia bacterium]